MVLADPFQESAPASELGLVQGGRVRLQLREHPPQSFVHRLPIVDRTPHVLEHTADVGGNVVENPLLGLAIHFDVDHGFGDRFLAIGSGQDA